MKTYRDIALLAAKWLKEQSSADDSGHADLGRRIEHMVSQVDAKEQTVTPDKTSAANEDTPIEYQQIHGNENGPF